MYHSSRSIVRFSMPMLAMGAVGVFSFDSQARNPPRGPDFDRDGYDDMAIGAYQDTEPGFGAGGINVLYGSSSGPEAPSLVTLHFDQDSSGVADTAESADYFGRSLAWGDFDDDGYDDLIIGVSLEDISVFGTPYTNTGFVNVLYGSSSGLSGTGSQSFMGGFGTTAYDLAEYDYFGENVAAGDFDGDGYDDVAIAATGFDTGGVYGVGAVVILYGSSSGLSVTGQQAFHQATSGMAGDGNQSGDGWGFSLVTGDFDCDGYEDLAVGTPWEEISGVSGTSHGAVTVIYGTSSGLSTSGSQWWHQNSTGILGTAGSDAFGWALAAGNFDGDSSSSRDCVDLAIGSITESEMGYTANGAVNVIYGGTSGLTTSGDQFIYQGSGLAGSPAASGEIGSGLTVGRFNSDSYDDLAVGAEEADPGGNSEAGEIYLAKGSSTGLTSSGSVRWDAATTGIPGARETGDLWGGDVCYAQFEGTSGNNYLIVGAYGENTDAGAVTTLELDSSTSSFDVVSGFEWFQDDIEGTPGNNERFGFAMPAPRLKARFAPV